MNFFIPRSQSPDWERMNREIGIQGNSSMQYLLIFYPSFPISGLGTHEPGDWDKGKQLYTIYTPRSQSPDWERMNLEIGIQGNSSIQYFNPRSQSPDGNG